MKECQKIDSDYMPTSVKQGILRTPIALLGLIILYRILLDVSYQHVAVIFDYQGLFFNRKNISSTFLSWLMLAVFSPFIVRLFSGKQFSDTVMLLLALFSLIPQTTVIAYRSDYSSIYLILITLFWLVLCVTHFFSGPIVFRPKVAKIVKMIPYFFLAMLISTVIIFSFINTGFRLHWDLINVYEIRAEARNFVAPFPVNYILSLADNALSFYAILLLHKRKYILFGIVIFTIFVNFSITGTKQIIFVLFCGMLGYWFIKNYEHSHRLVLAAIVLIASSLIESFLIQTNFLTTLYPYRVLFIPAELHNSYFNFFQLNELDLYRQSIFKLFFESPYTTNIQFLIGEFSIGDITARANNGLFSDAYMNIGVAGIVIYPLLIVILLRFFDGAVYRLDTRLWFVLVIYISFVLLGMTFSTALLTAGILPIFFILYMLPPDSIGKKLQSSSLRRNLFVSEHKPSLIRKGI